MIHFILGLVLGANFGLLVLALAFSARGPETAHRHFGL